MNHLAWQGRAEEHQPTGSTVTNATYNDIVSAVNETDAKVLAANEGINAGWRAAAEPIEKGGAQELPYFVWRGERTLLQDTRKNKNEDVAAALTR